jgi:pSer/pThr/pTyr-binding forkhead associated (FHA) protein
MAKIGLYFKDELLHSLKLKEGKEYIIGRADTCDIVIPPEKGISRQHLKLHYVSGTWKVEILSKYGELYLDNQKVNELVLDKDSTFKVPPYDLVFKAEPELAGLSQHNETFVPASTDSSEFSQSFGDERTVVTTMPMVAQVKLYNDNGEVTQIYRLEGDAWLAGRDTTCSIFIDNPKVSRRQFEIYRQDQVYFIRDAGSANGTLVNAQPLSTESWTQLQSGDIIQILNWSFQFELHDVGYEQRLVEANQFMTAPLVRQTSDGNFSSEGNWPDQPQYQDSSYEHSQEVFDQQPLPWNRFPWTKKNIIRASSASLLALALIGYFVFDSEPAKKDPVNKTISKSAQAFEKLTPAQKDYVKESFRLAEEFHMQGRYEMARQELIKVHQLVPEYSRSMDLKRQVEGALEDLAKIARLEKAEKDKAELAEKVQRQVEVCRSKINPKIEAREIEDCLSSVIQFNPEDPGILALKSEVDKLISDRMAQETQKADYLAKAQKQKTLYEKAKSAQRSGKSLLAIKAFQDVLNSNLPDPESLKINSKREIASIQKQLELQQSQLESQAESSYKSGDLKSAIVALKKSAEINPENQTTRNKVESMLFELKKQMQVIYQEGILEESVGEVETAKNKWKKIIEQSLPEEDYYKKAKIKLKKYGAM